MTNEERIDKMLHTLLDMQSNPNFRLHKFDIYEHPELENAKVVNERYTTKRGGVFETEDEWYLINDGKQLFLNQVITDKSAMLDFKSGLEKSNYALGGVIFN